MKGEIVLADDELNNLIANTDIVSLVSRYVSLEKKGKNYMGLCPFHNEKTPSFVVSPEKGLATCFGCHKGGNALTFLKEIENVSTAEAIKMLYEFNGVEYKGNLSAKEDPNKKYFEIMNTAKDFYKAYLNQDVSGLEAIKYLNSRGMDSELIDTFDVGLSPNIGDTIYQVLTKSGYLELDISDMSLVDAKQGRFYDIFSNRIMFPIKDEMGKTVAFSARIFGKDSKDKSQPKYINSRETKIFKKGETLFNLNLAKAHINKKHRVILHEGQMDVIASYKAGLGEAVCTLGTALTFEHTNKLRRYTDSAIICYDGDKAGIAASLKAINTFTRAGFNVHLVLLPNEMDPDEFVLKFGKEEYEKYFESHIIDSIEYQYQVLFLNKDLSDRTVLESIKNDVFSLIMTLNSQISEERYLQRLSESLNVSLDAVSADYNLYRSNHVSPAPEFFPDDGYDPGYAEPEYVDMPMALPNAQEPKKLYANMAELRIFKHAERSKQIAMLIDREIMDDMNILCPESQSLWNSLIYDYYMNFDEFHLQSFVRSLSDKDMQHYLYIEGELQRIYVQGIEFDDADLRDCISKIKELGAQSRNKHLKEQVNETSDDTEKSRLLDQVFKNKFKTSHKKDKNVKH